MLKSLMSLLGASKKKGVSSIKDLNKKVSGVAYLDGQLDPSNSHYLVLDSLDKLLTANLVNSLREQGDTVVVLDYDSTLMKLAGVSSTQESDLIINFKDKRFLAWNPLTAFRSEWDIPRAVKLIVHHLQLDDYLVSEQVESLLKKVLLYSFRDSERDKWSMVHTLLFKSPIGVLVEQLELSENDPILTNIEAIRGALFNFSNYGLFSNKSKDEVFLEDAVSAAYPGVIFIPLGAGDSFQEYFAKLALDTLLYSISNTKQESEHKFWVILSTQGAKFDFLNLSDCLRTADSSGFCLVETQIDGAERAPHLPHEMVDEVIIAKTGISLTYINEDTSRAVLDPQKIKEEVSNLKPNEYFRLYQGVLYKGVMPPIASKGMKKLLQKEDTYGTKPQKIEKLLVAREKPAVSGRSVPSNYVEPVKAEVYNPDVKVSGSSPTQDPVGPAESTEVKAVAPRTRFELPSSKRAKQRAFGQQSAQTLGLNLEN